MIIGIPKEIKNDEYRVSLIPAGVEQLKQQGHEVLVETGAGTGSGFSDEDYRCLGAQILSDREEVYRRAGLIVKVKEPQEEEFPLLRQGQVVFTYFHFAASRGLTDAMIRQGIVAIAYETIRNGNGTLPLLTPMSEIAGRMAIQEGAKYLEKPMEGQGILLGGAPGVAPARVVILGGGIVGSNAAKIAAGLGAQVTILDINLDRLRYLEDIMPRNVYTLMSNPQNIREQVKDADLLIGAVLVPGAKAPMLVGRAMIASMKPGAVVIDVAVDQGGCVETCRPTTHSRPTYTVDGVVHYCVANMPGAVGRTSTYALTNATFPPLLQIASRGWRAACRAHEPLLHGLNIVSGKITNRAVAETFGLPHVDPAPLCSG
jgi:alanine dehydrogenase